MEKWTTTDKISRAGNYIVFDPVTESYSHLFVFLVEKVPLTFDSKGTLRQLAASTEALGPFPDSPLAFKVAEESMATAGFSVKKKE